MIIRGKNLDWISRDNMDIKIFNKKDDFANASAAIIKVKDNHGKVKSTINDRLYYVVDGNGIFVISNKKDKVKKGDLIIVPKNTEYDFYGNMILFLVHVPAFQPE